ncbi:MAG: sulfite exporter TauE/SafE family protein [Candidatus Heimdallarchaeaceae archaeon]|uniref:Probable membrane transporter protein n=1 Tax=Candidatus Heimdallarchaeum endolithica TaxID=2876572 RepID=A0A9Y1BSZ9_9ARCH|nr:MAG: sulfite exporter TauE/SafE family protein [Candidatus Heimdallarchaeum endolithica]
MIELLGLSILVILGLFGLGLLIGAISPTFGIGGGLLTVPLLILLYDFSGEVATATSLGVIIFTSLSGSLAYIREKRIDFKIAFAFMIFAIPGSVSGALVSRWLKSQNYEIDYFQYIFAGTMIVIAIYKIATIFFQSKNKTSEKNVEEKVENEKEGLKKVKLREKFTVTRSFDDKRGLHFEYKTKLFPEVIIAFVGGFIGAMLGLGGGVIYVPILTMVLGIPAGIATATSTFTILFANPFAVALRWSSIQWNYVLFLSIGTIISANIVPKFLHKIKSKWILTGFWTIAILAAIRLLLKVSGVNI